MAYSVALNTGETAAKNEGGPGAAGQWVLKLTRDQDLGDTVYSFHVFNGTDPNPSDDFVGGADQVINWTAGQTEQLITITAVDDTTIENNETPIFWFYKGSTPAGSGTIATFNGITINNDDFTPVFTSSATVNAAENGTAVSTVTATAGSGTATYSITGGADAGLFSINNTTGVLVFNAPRNFEAPGGASGNGTYAVQITANAGPTTVQNLVVTLTNVNEAISITGAATVNTPLNENIQDVVAIATTDLDNNDTVAWSFSGADAAKFQVVNGMLQFKTAPDADVPGDADGDNIYNVVVRATDSGQLFAEQTHNVTINGVNEPAKITSYAGANTLFLNASENTATTVTLATVTAVDPEGDAIAWSAVGADGASFDATGGVLKFASVRDFEARNSIDGDNTYYVTVRATSTGGVSDQNFVLFLTDDVSDNNGGVGTGGGIITPPTPPAPPTTPGIPTTPTTPATPTAGSGNDSMLGTDFADVRSGGEGADTIDGGAGADSLDGDGGDDSVQGGEGDDFIRGLDGNDDVYGGAGNDTVNGNLGDDDVYGGDGADVVYGGQGQDLVFGGEGDDSYVNGNIGNDTVHGDGGNDSVYGGQNDDIIYGDGGDDLMSGDLGNDLMYGGDGADRFTILATGGSDWVMDFNGTAGDRIQLAAGTSYSIGSYQGQVLITVGGTATIGLAGVSVFDPSWVILA